MCGSLLTRHPISRTFLLRGQGLAGRDLMLFIISIFSRVAEVFLVSRSVIAKPRPSLIDEQVVVITAAII